MRDILAAVVRQAATNPDRVALSDAETCTTYGDLALRVGGLARQLGNAPPVIGISGASSIGWAVADLAVAASGRIAVPLPTFFSPDQLRHVVADAKVGLILAEPAALDQLRPLGVPVAAMTAPRAPIDIAGNGAKITYTSGSTGRPKGVRLGERQISATCTGLLAAVGATSADRHLSVLPYALLLENICGLYLPLLVGGRSHIAGAVVAAASPLETIRQLALAVQETQPSTLVLVPDLLRGWVAALGARLVPAPQGLRFVAVGGAPVPAAVADLAWQFGIPVHEGYGLSECCSVVAVNRPGERRADTVGRALQGTGVSIDEGEIVVSSASVMDGYLGQDAVDGIWRTGDLGSLDADGYLRVHGRKDSVIVLSNGRNVSPEWVETALAADSRVGRSIVIGHGRPYPIAIICPSLLGQGWFDRASRAEQLAWLAGLCRALPAYARPRGILLTGDATLAGNDLLTANRRPRRDRIVAHFATTLAQLYAEFEPAEPDHGIL